MKRKKEMKTTKIIIYPAIAVCALAYHAFSPGALAISPAPDGGYPGGNTAEGQNALFSLTTGRFNTAIGFLSLKSNATNNFTTAVGAGALFANMVDENTAIGAGALLSNTVGTNNTATGAFALFSNVGNGSSNSAFGSRTLFSNTVGLENTATGTFALFSNTSGNINTALGAFALDFNTTGNGNTAVGEEALNATTTGGNNTAIGTEAGFNVTGSANVCIGGGVSGVAGEDNTIRIADNLPNGTGQSACYIGGIAGQAVDPSSTTTVYTDNNGKLGVLLSSERFKRDIQPMNKFSEAVLALKPVTFHYKTDAKNIPCFGLLAEQVAQVNPDLVVRTQTGELLTVRYDAVNAMLLNEFLKEHQKVEEQQRRITTLESRVAGQDAIMAQQQKQMLELSARLTDHAANIQRLSAQSVLSRRAQRAVVRNQ